MTKEEDKNLLVAPVQHGDVVAFEKLLTRRYKPMRDYITGMVGSAVAEEVLQEISSKIYQRIKFLREPKAFRPWAYRIGTRIAFVHLKREKRWRNFETDPQILNAISATTSPDHDEMESEFLSLVDQVSPASRAVLLLPYQQHLSLEETAAILDIHWDGEIQAFLWRSYASQSC